MTAAATLRDVLLAHEATQPTATLLRSPETDRVLTYGQFAKEARHVVSSVEDASLHNLKTKEPERILYVGITDNVYEEVFQLPFPQMVIQEINMKIIVVNPELNTVVKWIK